MAGETEAEPRIAVVGAGLIGRSWAIVFARAGFKVTLFDADAQALKAAKDWIAETTRALARYTLIPDPDAVCERVTLQDDLAAAVGDAVYVQECVPEELSIKRTLFAALDRLAPADAILASSTSGIVASTFTGDLAGAARCLVAHPVNPPYLVPLVEICPAPTTDPEAVARTRTLLEQAGQAPVVVRREVRGFLLNRLQGAVLNEALRLFEDGYASAEDIDRTMKYGLGLRWSFMGPFETIDLNAPGGLADYAARYGPLYETLGQEQADPRPWQHSTVQQLEAERRQHLAGDALTARQAWRDRRLMALAAHKQAQSDDSSN
ncbi:3-hydroxyacyl-CoA dehydrogenase [Rhodovibrio salinarum]|uniref:L-gulonate 3-dehydrogenase n=1 Tax=Rhodovibrio salinarum TaxID=1087 RepID=A0A934QM43_9PROT|nr:3-hydroxyacyl-CoA dehydrogenase [Rhodovibrio salinarum]MBK1699124.1 3-hydroxyacyl-CoA dehydrogenase [Rhodovibrio salinarum]